MVRFLLMIAVLVAGLLAASASPASAHDDLVLVNGRLVRVNSFHHVPSVLRVQNVGHFHSNSARVFAVNGVRVSGRGVQVNAGRGVRVNVGGGVRVSSRNTPFRPRVGNVVRIR